MVTSTTNTHHAKLIASLLLKLFLCTNVFVKVAAAFDLPLRRLIKEKWYDYYPKPQIRRLPARYHHHHHYCTRYTSSLYSTKSQKVNDDIISAPPSSSSVNDDDDGHQSPPPLLLLRIHGTLYNLTDWAAAHPGGVEILYKFNTTTSSSATQNDATRAFHNVGHSTHAWELLSTLPVVAEENEQEKDHHKTIHIHDTDESLVTTTTSQTPNAAYAVGSKWRKLFTKEDPYAIHKTLGIYCILHFLYRYGVALIGGNAAAGLTTTSKALTILTLLPHALLSLSSFLFVTVPRRRVVGKTIIWQEYRVHNAVFAWRSVVTTLLALWGSNSFVTSGGDTVISNTLPDLGLRRRIAVVGSSLVTLFTMVAADRGTALLRDNPNESTTATMPYWSGCTPKREQMHKLLYAYSQFMATLACLWTTNPALPFSVLMVIQVASFLMTLSRKSIISTYQSHMIYTVTLFLPWLVGLRGMVQTSTYMEFSGMTVMGMLLFFLRKKFRINKYFLWLPVMICRVAWGDQWLDWSSW
jgi:cytochrome b involved in lipid metabolism